MFQLALCGNNENISLMEHITGYEAGKSINYFYYPLSEKHQPKVIGSFNGISDEKLVQLLSVDKQEKKFVHLSSSRTLPCY